MNNHFKPERSTKARYTLMGVVWSASLGLSPLRAAALASETVTLRINDDVTDTGINQFTFSSGRVRKCGYPVLFEGGNEYWTIIVQLTELPSFKMPFLDRLIRLDGRRTDNGGRCLSRRGTAGEIESYRNCCKNQDLLWENEALSNGEHTIRVVLKGRHNKAGTMLEAVVFETGIPAAAAYRSTQIINDGDEVITKDGDWCTPADAKETAGGSAGWV